MEFSRKLVCDSVRDLGKQSGEECRNLDPLPKKIVLAVGWYPLELTLHEKLVGTKGGGEGRDP